MSLSKNGSISNSRKTALASGSNANTSPDHNMDPSGSSGQAPPTFEQSKDHILVDFSHSFSYPGGEEPPPDFTPYQAEFSVTDSGWIVSHDSHLNEDGEALYRFLLSQATVPPVVLLHCTGSHNETRTRFINSTDHEGRCHTTTEAYDETVTDFDFSINVGQNIVTGPVHWSIADSDAAYRGLMVREAELPDGRRIATKDEIKTCKAWTRERIGRGLPPWVGSDSWHATTSGTPGGINVMKSSKTLRQWADDYCASPKYLKEFLYEKVIHGWNIDRLKIAVRSAIGAAHYSGNVEVRFELLSNKICVRSDNKLSRTLSNKWLKFLFYILLIYPIIWLFKRFHSRGGGRWEVCGGAYALKHWEPVDSKSPISDSASGSPVLPADFSIPRLIRTEHGMTKLIGMTEDEWFARWEGTIKSAVTSRMQSSLPIVVPKNVQKQPRRFLFW